MKYYYFKQKNDYSYLWLYIKYVVDGNNYRHLGLGSHKHGLYESPWNYGAKEEIQEAKKHPDYEFLGEFETEDNPIEVLYF